MREHDFNKIKKTLFILLAVFLVISLTTTSASAWYSKTSDGKCKEVAKEKVVKEVVKEKVVIKEVAKPVTEAAKIDWFGGCWGIVCYDCWDNCWNNCLCC